MKSRLLLLPLLFIASALWTPAAPVTFTRAFAPAEGWVKPPEQPFRAELCLNGQWQFQPQPLPAGYQRDQGTPPELPPPDPARWEATPIKIPSPWNVNVWGNGGDVGAGTRRPYVPDSVYYPSYPANWDHAEMGWLRRGFTIPEGWNDGRRIVLHFEAVAGECQILVNGKKAGEHFDRFLPFDVDITGLVRRGAPNELLVGVRAHTLFHKSSARYGKFHATYPPGSNTDRIIGIWQDVFLLGLPPVRVEDAFIKPLVDRDTLELEVRVRNDSARPQEVAVGGAVQPWVNLAGPDVLSAPEPRWKLDAAVLKLAPGRVSVAPGATATLTLREKVGGRLRSWSPETPNLYGAVLTSSVEGRESDRHFTRFGWRQLKIQGGDLMLNGQKIQLYGDLCHPFGPYMMSRRFAWSWFKMIKDFHGNAVRPHANIYPRYYLDLADEMGIMVLDETGLFGSSIQLNFEAPEAWERFAAHYDGLVLRDRNHPSVFGWSFGNELFAIFRLNNVNKADTDAWYARLTELGNRARKLDATREWISCDGDEDLRGTLPVWSKHFGHGLPLKELPGAELNKPLMVGESGGSYYAKPGQLAEFNGDRAYESYAGRNEALAIDLYQNVARMARPRLAYFSASETVWFGLEHLPLGLRDFTRIPNRSDGVFFGPHAEGQPGMQLERIPPYMATLNPGWDPELPLYQPLAMFEALKAALAPGGPAPSPWDHKPEVRPRPRPAVPTIERVLFAGDRAGSLYRALSSYGVPIDDNKKTDAAKMMIIDGERLSPEAAGEVKKTMDAVLGRGGVVLVMLRQPQAPLEAINKLLPAPLRLTARTATALTHRDGDPWTASLGLKDLYFAEEEAGGRSARGGASARNVLGCGLDGDFVKSGRVLLEAGNTDWALFNQAPEAAKCGSVVMHEKLQKPAGAALAVMNVGPGKLAVSAIDYQPPSAAYRNLWRRLLTGMGVKLSGGGAAGDAGPGGHREHDLLLDGPMAN